MLIKILARKSAFKVLVH